jgi:hypothetical protein
MNPSYRRQGDALVSKRYARGLLSAITVTAVVLTAILGGQRYMYCRSMNQVMTDGCCECARGRAPADGVALLGVDNDCFEVRVLGRLVAFALPGDMAVPAAALVAILPPPVPDRLPARGFTTGARHPIRAGPFSPTATRARLMVFLT